MGLQFWKHTYPDGTEQLDADPGTEEQPNPNYGKPYVHVLDEGDGHNAACIARISHPTLNVTQFDASTGWPDGEPTAEEWAARNGTWERVNEDGSPYVEA